MYWDITGVVLFDYNVVKAYANLTTCLSHFSVISEVFHLTCIDQTLNALQILKYVVYKFVNNWWYHHACQWKTNQLLVSFYHTHFEIWVEGLEKLLYTAG